MLPPVPAFLRSGDAAPVVEHSMFLSWSEAEQVASLMASSVRHTVDPPPIASQGQEQGRQRQQQQQGESREQERKRRRRRQEHQHGKNSKE